MQQVSNFPDVIAIISKGHTEAHARRARDHRVSRALGEGGRPGDKVAGLEAANDAWEDDPDDSFAALRPGDKRENGTPITTSRAQSGLKLVVIHRQPHQRPVATSGRCQTAQRGHSCGTRGHPGKQKDKGHAYIPQHGRSP